MNQPVSQPCKAEFRATPSWLQSRLQEIAALCQRCHVQKLELFGSATTDAFDPATSDLDFLVLFRPRKPEDPVYYFELREALEDLFQRKVDVIDETAVDNPFFLMSIAPTRILVYAA